MADKEIPRNINANRDLIECCIEASRFSKLPYLLLGNPGTAKTTCIEHWAERNGYYVESLVGSRHSQEEILGYMVKINDGEINENLVKTRVEHLKTFCPTELTDAELTQIALTTLNNDQLNTLTPDWYNRVMAKEKEGIPSVLFLDEISGCPENVQASLLTLIFDRVVGNGAKLPESTIVIGAANYKENLGGVFTIIPPALNRFVIMNLEFGKIEDLLDEFLQDPTDLDKNLVDFQHVQVTPEVENLARMCVKDMMERVFSNYTSPGNDNSGVLNLKNQNYAEMYDNNGKPVYNFISGRTVSYLARVATAIYHLDLGKKIHERFVDGCCLGLVGLGTNSFTSDKQAEEYQTSVKKLFHKVVKDLKAGAKGSTVTHKTLNFAGMPVHQAISDWTRYNESVTGNVFDENVAVLYNYVYEHYNCSTEHMAKMLARLEKASQDDIAEFINDLTRIDGLAELIDKNNDGKSETLKKNLHIIQNGWAFYKDKIIDTLTKK
jgi:hypothetical protein